MRLDFSRKLGIRSRLSLPGSIPAVRECSPTPLPTAHDGLRRPLVPFSVRLCMWRRPFRPCFSGPPQRSPPSLPGAWALRTHLEELTGDLGHQPKARMPVPKLMQNMGCRIRGVVPAVVGDSHQFRKEGHDVHHCHLQGDIQRRRDSGSGSGRTPGVSVYQPGSHPRSFGSRR